MRQLMVGLILAMALNVRAEPIQLNDWIAGQANQTLALELSQRFRVNQPALYTLPDFAFVIEGRGDHIALIASEYDVVMAIKDDVSWPPAISLSYLPNSDSPLRLQTPSIEEYEQASENGTALVGQGTLTWQVDVRKQAFYSIEALDTFVDQAARAINLTDLRWNRYKLNQLYREWVQTP